jgi:sugar (pentulose or hexulose) kinase
MDGLILSIDCGTQSVRALLFDRKGNLLAKVKAEFEPYVSTQPGWAEQNPEVYWDSACSACQRLKASEPELWSTILAVVVTTQRDTCICLDQNGNVLRDAIVWLDQREAKCEQPLKAAHRAMFSLVGMTRAIEVARRKTKANWLRENQPEIWEKTAKYLLVSGFFAYRMTGKYVDSVASQIGHIPFDYKNKCWPVSKSHYNWDVFGVRREQLPDLVRPGEDMGGLTAQAARQLGLPEGLPVLAGASDKGCETLGMGCLSPESASISFGTTATIQTTTKTYMEPIAFMPSYMAAVPERFNPEIQIYRGYWMISWFKKEFGEREVIEAKKLGVAPEDLLNKRLAEVPPGSEGLMLQPYWTAGLKSPEARGAIIGFSDAHTRAHIYRAIIEGINFALMDGLKSIVRCTKTRTERIMVSGGGSQSDMICQITADMFNLPVCKGQTHEASGLGAAIIGYVSTGAFSSYEEAVRSMVHYARIFEPDAAAAKLYREMFTQIYQRIYKSLQPLYKRMETLT